MCSQVHFEEFTLLKVFYFPQHDIKVKFNDSLAMVFILILIFLTKKVKTNVQNHTLLIRKLTLKLKLFVKT